MRVCVALMSRKLYGDFEYAEDIESVQPLRDIIKSDTVSSVGYSSLKNEQTRAIEAFIGGKDVFVSSPTGYGIHFCFALLPVTMDDV